MFCWFYFVFSQAACGKLWSIKVIRFPKILRKLRSIKEIRFLKIY